MVDLWPENIVYDQIKAPVTILKEQASLLGKKTKNIVIARVEVLQAVSRRQFAYNFLLIAPALGNYRYQLFTMTHGIELYPVEFQLDEDMAKELQILAANSNNQNPIIRAETEAQFLEILQMILRSEKTMHVIRSILAQSVGLSDTDPS